MWFDLHGVKPREAAMLLCQFNPHDDRCDPLEVFNPETGPDDYKQLLRVFEDVANAGSQPRTLMQWLAIARDKGLEYHSWIDEYVNAAMLVQKDGELNANPGAPESDEPAAPSEKKTSKRSRITPNVALIERCVADGAKPHIEVVWLHIRSNAGKEGFPISTANDESATYLGNRITKTQLDSALKRYRKKS